MIFLGLDLRIIDELLASLPSYEDVASLNDRQMKRLCTIRTVQSHQKHMLDTDTRKVDHRIAGLSKAYVRPIVRGKARAKVEFGAKLLVAAEKSQSFVS